MLHMSNIHNNYIYQACVTTIDIKFLLEIQKLFFVKIILPHLDCEITFFCSNNLVA